MTVDEGTPWREPATVLPATILVPAMDARANGPSDAGTTAAVAAADASSSTVMDGLVPSIHANTRGGVA